MKRAIVLLLALLLAPAARADAKFSSARVCGPSNCHEVTLTAGHSLATIQEAALLPQALHLPKPPDAAPWYRVTLCPERCDSPNAPKLKVLPAGGYQYLPPRERLARKGWTKLDEPAADVYRRIASGLKPFPASHLVAIGAEAPDLSGQGGTPTWVWIAIATAAAAIGLCSLGWRRGSRRSALVR
jgi:hypothetical protein